jgi:hypothetical protein
MPAMKCKSAAFLGQGEFDAAAAIGGDEGIIRRGG